MNFGNYSCLTKNDIKVIIFKKKFWSNYSGTLKKFIIKLDTFHVLEAKDMFNHQKCLFLI